RTHRRRRAPRTPPGSRGTRLPRSPTPRAARARRCGRATHTSSEDVGAATEDERRVHVLIVDARERRVLEVGVDIGPRPEPERAGTLVGAEAEQAPDGDHVAAERLAPRRSLELPELFERIDADVRIGADADADAPIAEPLHRREAVAEICLRRRAEADARAGLGEEVELPLARVRGVHDRRMRAEATRARKQLDRPEAMLGEALLDLARLLVRVHVQRELVRRGVPADLVEPVGRAGADGVGGEPHASARVAQRLDLTQVLGDRLLTESRQPSSPVSAEEQHLLDARLARRLDGGVRLREAEVVELADRRVAGGEHLAVGLRVDGADGLRRLACRLLEHRLAPRPEVAALGAPAERALEGVRVRVDEAGEGEA